MHVSIKLDATELLKVATFHPVPFRGITFNQRCHTEY